MSEVPGTLHEGTEDSHSGIFLQRLHRNALRDVQMGLKVNES